MSKIMMGLGLALVAYGLIADKWEMSVGGIGWIFSSMIWEWQ